MMFKLFKHKPVKVIVKDKKKRILESSFKSLGVADVDDSIIKTVDNDKFYMFDFTYLEPNGVDDETDKRNHFLMRQLLNSLEGKIKFYFIDETKCNLNKNIEFYENRLKENLSDNIKKCIINRIQLMKAFNDEKYVTMLVLVESRHKDLFLSMTRDFLNVNLISGKKLLNILDMLNNEMSWL